MPSYCAPGSKGWSALAAAPVLRGSFVCLYAGELVGSGEAARRLAEYDCLARECPAAPGHALLVRLPRTLYRARSLHAWMAVRMPGQALAWDLLSIAGRSEALRAKQAMRSNVVCSARRCCGCCAVTTTLRVLKLCQSLVSKSKTLFLVLVNLLP